MEFIQTWVMIKVLGLDSISKDMSIAKNKMTLAERRITKEAGAAKEAGGKNQSDAITKTCEKLREVSRGWCETSQNRGFRTEEGKKLKLLDVAHSGFSVDTIFGRTALVSHAEMDAPSHEMMKS